MRVIKALSVGTMLGLVASVVQTTRVSADEYSNNKPEFSVALSAIDGQQDDGSTTWNIKTQPGKKFGGVVYIQNTSAAEATFHVSVEQGFTNNNLVVGYASGHNNDSLAKTMDLRKIVKVPQESVTVGAGQTVYAPINFKMADQSFDGTVVGAVVVTKDVPGKAVKKSGFTNQFTYVKGVKIAETDKQVNANLTEAKKGRVVSGTNQQVFQLGVANNEANYIGDMSVATTISKGNQTVLTDKQTNQQVTPNSTFTYSVPAEKVLTAGKYRYHVKMTDVKSKQSWTFTGDFTISAAQQGQTTLQRTTAFIPTWIWWLIGILAAALLFVIILLLRRKKQDDEDK